MDSFFYADESKTPHGPVSLAELRALVTTGTVKARTFVIPENGGAWQRWSDLDAVHRPASMVNQSLVPVTTPSRAPVSAAPVAARAVAAGAGEARRVANCVVKVTLYSGLIGSLVTNARASLEQAMLVHNAQGWRVLQVMPHLELNLFSMLLRVLLLVCTLGMFTIGTSYLLVFERDVA